MRSDAVKIRSATGANSFPAGSHQWQAHAFYRALMEDSGPEQAEAGFGGRLLYARELDWRGRAMMVAGNVAGCATLAVTPDESARKLAIRDGVSDFVVTSLDEALRILKNEIRKHNAVSVCIGADRHLVEQEMLERGVLPDIVLGKDPTGSGQAVHFGESVREIQIAESRRPVAFMAWQISQNPGRWMPMLDRIAFECLVQEPWIQRWIRLSPRYLGRAGTAERAFSCEPQAASRILRQFEIAVGDGAIAAEVAVSIIDGDKSKALRLSPATH
jgi:urocanate hydratase